MWKWWNKRRDGLWAQSAVRRSGHAEPQAQESYHQGCGHAVRSAPEARRPVAPFPVRVHDVLDA
eukprot:8227156-Pyramimonas_sp.AAC.1